MTTGDWGIGIGASPSDLVCAADTPVGVLTLRVNDHAVTGLSFEQPDYYAEPNDMARRALKELAEYFSGERRGFDVPLEFRGTPFLEAAWNACKAVPYGETATYGDLAKAIDRPQAQRAVGTAMKRNPIAIIIPCHRIVKATGDPCENYFGGKHIKEFLLKLEQ